MITKKVCRHEQMLLGGKSHQLKTSALREHLVVQPTYGKSSKLDQFTLSTEVKENVSDLLYKNINIISFFSPECVDRVPV